MHGTYQLAPATLVAGCVACEDAMRVCSAVVHVCSGWMGGEGGERSSQKQQATNDSMSSGGSGVGGGGGGV